MSMIINPVLRAGRAIDHWLLEPTDARIYACLRIAYGLVCFAIVIETWPIRDELFSELGMSWRRPDLLWYLPLKYVRSPGAVSWLMVGAGLAATMMTIGLFTRFAALFLYLWNFAYCAIGYPAESGYDGIARIVGFVLLCGPAMRTWSLDARIFGPGEAESPRYALRMLQFQIVVIYVATVWLKAPDSYWRSGELMAYFMMSMYSRFPHWIWASWGRTSVLMSWGSLICETLIPFCLFSPRFRRFGFLLGIGLHGGIAATSTIGMFSFAMVPLYCAFLTREDIDDVIKLGARLRPRPKPASAPAGTRT